MKNLLALLPLIVIFISFSAFAALKVKDMRNTALQAEINRVSQVNFTESLRMAQEIWAQKQQALYHSSLTNAKDWPGKRVYELISYALARENQRLTANPQQADSIVIPLTDMIILLEKTTNPDEDIREAKLLFSQALMLEEIRLYTHSSPVS